MSLTWFGGLWAALLYLSVSALPAAEPASSGAYGQAPVVQGLMGNYLEQSAKVFLEMQEQMRKQARGMFGAFQFPGFPPGQTGNEDK